MTTRRKPQAPRATPQRPRVGQRTAAPTSQRSSAKPVGGRRPDVRFATHELWELSGPTTVFEKLEWLELRGSPDYLYLPGERGALQNGREYIAFQARDFPEERREIRAVYNDIFVRPGPPSRKKVLRSYTANFPHVAFDRQQVRRPSSASAVC